MAVQIFLGTIIPRISARPALRVSGRVKQNEIACSQLRRWRSLLSITNLAADASTKLYFCMQSGPLDRVGRECSLALPIDVSGCSVPGRLADAIRQFFIFILFFFLNRLLEGGAPHPT